MSALAPTPAPRLRARGRSRVTTSQLEQFIVADVQLTGITLGAGAYGSVEEVELPGAKIAAKKLHPQLINLGSPQQVQTNLHSVCSDQWCRKMFYSTGGKQWYGYQSI